MKNNKINKISTIGAGGSAGIAGLLGACGGTCGAAALPLGSFLSSLGIGSAVTWLPKLGIPLFVVGLILGIFSLYRLTKINRPITLAVVSVIMAALFTFSAFQLFSKPCSDTSESIVSKMSDPSKIIAKEIYIIWPELGRAPTAKELSNKLKLEESQVLQAYKEFRELGLNGMFYKNTEDIKWFWPLSSSDHGFKVTLEGKKEVFARCSIDALGMSSMYNLPATIEAVTPIEKNKIRVKVLGDKVISGDQKIIITEGKGCNDMLLFSSQSEYDQYIAKKGIELKAYTLEKGLKYGVKIFKNRLKILNI